MDWGHVAKRLSLGVGAILLASSVLLLSDLKSRHRNQVVADAPAANRVMRVALLQHVSQPILEDGARGVIAGLEEAGYTEGQNLKVDRFNAEGDLATSNAIALQIVNGGYDLAVTLSTPSLQSLANANRDGKVIHLFGMVTDPVAAKVGITGSRPEQHPPHLVGLGTLQPVADSVKMARRFYPELKTLGVVWNPAEINSQVTTKMCREICATLGIKLEEVSVENTSQVRESTAAVIARGVDAVWIGGDVTVLAAVDPLLSLTKTARIPVFTVIPGNADKGALFDLGANYFEVGRQLGEMAGRVLSGTSPTTIPVELYVPPKLSVNALALQGLSAPWKVPADLRTTADQLIDEQGAHKKPEKPRKSKATPKTKGPLARKWKVRLLQYVNLPDVAEAEKGVLDAIREDELVEGRDFEKVVQNANGEMALLGGLVDSAVTDNADLLITFSTPTLQAAMQRAPTRPTVFTFLADPMAAGAGKSDTDHRPNVSGAYGSGDAPGLIAIIRQLLPNARRIGVLFCPAEINSVYNRQQVEAAAKQAGIEVVALGVDTPAEVGDTATALTTKSIDLLCLPTSNLTATTFPSIVQATRRAKLPVFAFLGGLAVQGSAVTLARDYYDMGHNAGKVAARIMRGESPANIPFAPSRKNTLLVNLEAARQCGLVLPESFIKSAKVIGR